MAKVPPCTPPHVLLRVTALALLSACDIPTSVPTVPIVDLRWTVPSQAMRISVANLLPSGVTIPSDSSGFLVSVTPASAQVTRTLAQDCPACVAANRLTVPKPAFVASASMAVSAPSDIASAMLTGGTLNIQVTNNYNFDPLRPSAAPAAPRGYAIFTVMNGSTQLGKDSVNGATTALAANGGTLSRSVALAGNISGSAPVTVSVTVSSPGGDRIQMDASRTISVTATPANLKVATANVIVTNRSVSSSSAMDLSGVEFEIVKRVQSGSLLLTVANPFTVAGTLTVRFMPSGGAAITKTVPLAAGNSTPKIDFTQAELQSLLGKSVTVSYGGTVTSTSGAVTISPKQAVIVTTRFDLSLRVEV